jgi:hypothetical protein
MLLIHPPVAKPCEPPAGIAKLSGALMQHGIKHRLLDANIEALLSILKGAKHYTHSSPGTWTARSIRNLSKNLEALKGWRLYQNIDRYGRAVADINHAVEVSMGNGVVAGLANYRHAGLSPLRSGDLVRAAEHPEHNPFYPYFKERLSQLIPHEAPSYAGFSLNYLSQAICTFAMIGFIKQRFPGLKIVLGGGLITSWMSNPNWKNPFTGLIDTLVSGPGEHQLLEIMSANRSKCRYYTPDYESMPLNDYLSPGLSLPYSASSGCYWNKCSFCPEKAENNPYIPIPVHRVVDDLHTLAGKTKPVLVHLLDNAVSTALLKALSENPLRIPWYGFARINRNLTDIDFCMALKRSGCVMLKLGLESGDQGVLDKMQKGIDLETASLALKTLKKSRIAAYVYLIFGTPAETLSEARSTLDFVIRHKDEINYLNLALFNMPVCGPEAREFKTSSFYDGDLSLYTNFEHQEGWNRKQVRLFLDNEFKKHKAVSEILKNDPPFFTSNHAPFFIMEHK